ncbi:MAG: hypothetical protein ABL952_16460, partial [Pyrinomonadaceae bacterium]
MKNTGLWIRTAVIIAVTIGGIILVFGPRRAPVAADFTYQGIKDNLSQNISLGLDLKGGSHLVMKVKTDDYLKTLTENNAQAALNAVLDAKLPVTGNPTTTENGKYTVTLNLSDATQSQAVIDKVKEKVDFANWTESVSGNDISWTLPAAMQEVLKKQAVEQALKIIESRINAYGVKEPTLQRHGAESSGQILLQMPGVDDPERVKILIGSESNLALMKIVSPASPAPVATYQSEDAARASLGGTVPPNRKILPYSDRDEPTAANAAATPDPNKPKQYVVVEYPSIVDGSELRQANAMSRTGSDRDFEIGFSLKPAGAQKFGDWTGKNINNYMGVVLNNEVKSAAFIKSQIFDS